MVGEKKQKKAEEEPVATRRKQNSEAAKRFRQKRKRAEMEIREDHARLKASRERMIEAIVRLKAICQENKLKIPDLGLEEGDIAQPDKAETTVDILASAGGKAVEKRKETVMLSLAATQKDTSDIKHTIRESEGKIMRRLRVVIEKLEEIEKQGPKVGIV
uniref:BZIP domain-containing protein n=1 Tax=Aplanochytrium stocchinoi TaxID=215587 RepID=A0A7S3PG48_9STRA|mmetsp:Transcript_14577/g.18013  ORF Transcript_14577/g.18013 Transcript_14577/m.18013 type:complete len:160 (+) Transcript_14577:168-647(+)|eukprot:CAMPEP_0204825530 /NCGR_PEP_ID=MMETSP1346-20131115/3396_1 /ASSEMBLY_ACC=CAM_ASM_000771 /TAXON_ID=215587 /ORGANISM="Aplanochytrium stocchinoi, Strain GSBS06" /LENGTH=159 /DNA_ID=CAMNT_0051953187 /DNA_START=157 /DNA_END=636 /DNA_ORIENTATION=-